MLAPESRRGTVPIASLLFHLGRSKGGTGFYPVSDHSWPFLEGASHCHLGWQVRPHRPRPLRVFHGGSEGRMEG
jgi:hypothetical protein